MLQRYTVFFVAGVLPLLFVGQIAPRMAGQLDFWLLWLVAMTLVGLPVLFAESALSARTANVPWLGMQSLTREADAAIWWRVFAGLCVLVSVLAASSISTKVAANALAYFPEVATTVAVPTLGVAAALSVVALILSLLKSRTLLVGALLLLLGSLIALFDSSIAVPVLTEVSLGEWSRAVVLALLSVGVGTGLYWFGSMHIAPSWMHAKRSLTSFILPIWFVQLIFGSFALLASSALVNQLSFVISSLGMLLVAAFLLYYVGVQLIARFGLIYGALLTSALTLLATLVPQSLLLAALIILSLLAVFMLAVFTGFVMKISHLRKTLNFRSELRYSLWRVLVRIIVPFAVLSALIGTLMELMANV